MVRIAIVGTGSISSHHIEGYRTFADECTIKAVCDIDPAKAQQCISEHRLSATLYTDYRELAKAQDIDLVSICTPPSTHAETAIALLRSGKHVLVEKPMAASLEECDAMNDAAQAAGRLLSVVAQNRFRESWMKLKRLLSERIAGEVLHAQADSLWWRGHSYYDLWWRGTWASEGGGCTLNHAVHHIDGLQWMMGPPTEVRAVMANVAHDNAEVEDISLAMLRFSNGSVGQITSSVVHHGQEQRLVFQCERAKLAAPWSVYASCSKENGFPERDTGLEERIRKRYEELPRQNYEDHTGQIENVLQALKGSGELLVDGSQGRKTLELIVAIYKSAAKDETVPLPLAATDPFYTKEGMLSAIPHFYEKSGYVKGFKRNEISTRTD